MRRTCCFRQIRPWHSATAATYAWPRPLRRLADRYVVMATLAIANGRPVPDEISSAFTKLPEVMRHADDTANQIERAVIDLGEVALISSQTQRTFEAVVTDVDDRGSRIQLCKLPVVSRVDTHNVEPGDDIRVRLVSADIPGRCEVRASRLISQVSLRRSALRH